MKTNLLYIIKNIVFILFIGSLVYLIPTIISNIYGIILSAICLVYVAFEFVLFVIKNKKISTNVMRNFASLLLYLYMFMLAYKVVNQGVENPYFFINYILAGIVVISLIGSAIIPLLDNPNEKIIEKG